jgi:hypothetical protein
MLTDFKEFKMNFSSRIARRGLTLGLCAFGISLILAPASASAQSGQIGSFESGSGIYSYSNATGVLSGVTSGNFTYDPFAIANLGAPAGTFVGAMLSITATATGAVTGLGTAASPYLQYYNGSVTVTSGGSTLVMTTFTNAFIATQAGVSSVTLLGATSQGATVIHTSTMAPLINTTVDPRLFDFSLSNVTPGISVSGSNFADFTGNDTAKFDTSLQQAIAPEPSTVLSAAMGVLLLGAYGLRRKVAA